MTDLEVVKKMHALNHSANSRSIHFNLSFRTVKKLLSAKRCYYTGVPFQDNGEFARTVDRVDNDKGYVDDNVVACTQRINAIKSNMTVEELRAIMRGVQKKFK